LIINIFNIRSNEFPDTYMMARWGNSNTQTFDNGVQAFHRLVLARSITLKFLTRNIKRNMVDRNENKIFIIFTFATAKS